MVALWNRPDHIFDLWFLLSYIKIPDKIDTRYYMYLQDSILHNTVTG